MTDTRNIKKYEWIFGIIMLLYPLRHVHWGIDLWDTGYNYANFQYMGLEHMDSMWLYSTYLANALGHLFTKLPFGQTLIGLNVYTELLVSLLAIMGYWFMTRKLEVKPWVAFLGEWVAISLCWCPTALLYNYLTYVLFTACVILLYLGLTKEKNGYLVAAGVCLGVNVFVRFSNLPEAALIVAVWVYAVLVGREKKEKFGSIFSRAFETTVYCLGGYLVAVIVLLGYMHVRYGLSNYIEGIMRLFAMTDNATDYKATSMIMGVIGTYVENLYWAIRIGVIVVAGVLFFAVSKWIGAHLGLFAKNEKHQKALKWVTQAIWCAVCVAMLVWLYARGFCDTIFYAYGSMLRPGILFLMLAMLIALIRIVQPKTSKEVKLISGLLILVILLTSIGSNNGVYPSINHLFLVAPYCFWQIYEFFVKAKEWSFKGVTFCAFPVKGIIAAFIAMFVFQSSGFGAGFTFAEATGVQNVTATVDNNEVLTGVKMNPERAQWMEEISAYVAEQGLEGREVILYGQLPALSFYLQMPSAFNPWSDLRSYNIETMQAALDDLNGDIELGKSERPVVIVESDYARHAQGGSDALKALDRTVDRIHTIENDEKWYALSEFMAELGYQVTFMNDKFAVWE